MNSARIESAPGARELACASETSVEPVIRAHVEKMVTILTDQQVKLKTRVTYTGTNDSTFMRCLLIPCNPSNPPDSPDYSKYGFYYDESSDGTFEIYHGINAGLDVPKCQEMPFIKGLVFDFMRRNIGYSCRMEINDPEMFCESMKIDTLDEISNKILLDHLFKRKNISESVVSKLGIEKFHIDRHTISMNVVADIEDHRAFVALARDKYQKQWSDNDWYPDSMAEALQETTLLSNGNPAPIDMGYEILAVDKLEHEMMPKPEHEMMPTAKPSMVEPSMVSDADAPEL